MTEWPLATPQDRIIWDGVLLYSNYTELSTVDRGTLPRQIETRLTASDLVNAGMIDSPRLVFGMVNRIQVAKRRILRDMDTLVCQPLGILVLGQILCRPVSVSGIKLQRVPFENLCSQDVLQFDSRQVCVWQS
jgi:hypothetical protein